MSYDLDLFEAEVPGDTAYTACAGTGDRPGLDLRSRLGDLGDVPQCKLLSASVSRRSSKAAV
jgi:hypothetical protein